MAIETYTVQLERVQAAIAAIEGGAQSYSIADRALSRANLADLYKREKYLRAMVRVVKAGHLFSVGLSLGFGE